MPKPQHEAYSAASSTASQGPRQPGQRAAVRVLLASRSILDQQRTANRNALLALLRSVELGVDARRPLTDAEIRTIAAWRTTRSTAPHDSLAVARREARRLANAVLEQGELLKENHRELHQLVDALAPGLQDQPGVGPVTAAIIVCAYSHHGRVRAEAAFAALGGVAPVPASSGNTTRHRLSRSGDRQLNRAFDVILRSQMSYDEATRDYVARRRTEGPRTARSAAASSATFAARSSANSRPRWLDARHRSVIFPAGSPATDTPQHGAGPRSPAPATESASCLTQFGVVRRGRAGPEAVLDVGPTQPVAQTRLGDAEVSGDLLSDCPGSRLRATRTTSSRNSLGNGLGTVHILPAAPLSATDQMSPIRAAVSRDV